MRRLKRFAKFLKFFIFALLLGIVVSIPFVIPRLITIKKIECESQYGECPQDIQLAIINLQFSNLTKTKKEIAKALKNNLLVNDFSEQYKFPSTLKVNILIKKAVFALKDKNSDNYFLVDREGLIVAGSNASGLPTVMVSGMSKNLGEAVSESELLALRLQEGVFTMYQVVTGEIKDNALHIELPAHINVIFPLRDADSELLLGSLRLIYAKIESMEEAKYQEIDLRFRNPVLR